MGEIEENNKLIAEFMGDKEYVWKTHFANWIREEADLIGIEDLRFHESWTWLMPVVEKIERLVDEEILGSVDFIIGSGEVRVKANNYLIYLDDGHAENGSKIKAVNNAVVEFIKWYNENVKSKTSGKWKK